MVTGSELLAGESMDEPFMAMQAFTMVLAGCAALPVCCPATVSNL